MRCMKPPTFTKPVLAIIALLFLMTACSRETSVLSKYEKAHKYRVTHSHCAAEGAESYRVLTPAD